MRARAPRCCAAAFVRLPLPCCMACRTLTRPHSTPLVYSSSLYVPNAHITLVLRALRYLPRFHLDPTALPTFLTTFLRAVLRCLRLPYLERGGYTTTRAYHIATPLLVLPRRSRPFSPPPPTYTPHRATFPFPTTQHLLSSVVLALMPTAISSACPAIDFFFVGGC